MLTVLHGANRLAIAERVSEIQSTIDPAGVNTSRFDDARQQIGELQIACGAPGFFGTTRLIIATDLLAPKSGGRGRRSTAKADDNPALALLATIPDTTHLIVVETQLATPIERAVRKAAPDATIERHDVPRGRDLTTWVCERARAHQATMPADAAEQLLEAIFPGTWRAAGRRDDLPPNLYRLDSELAKLAVAAARSGRITPELVTELVPEAEATNLWGLTDAIAGGDPAAAVRELELAIGHGTAPELLLAQLAGQFEAFAAVRTVERSGDLRRAAAVSGLTEGRLRQAARSARRFSDQHIKLALDLLRSVDRDTKLGIAESADQLAAVVAQIAGAARR